MHYIQFFPYFPLLYPVFSIFRKHSFPHRTSFSYFCPDDPLRSHFSLSFFSEKFTQKCVLIFLFLTSVLEASILPPSCQNDLETVVHIKLIFQNL